MNKQAILDAAKRMDWEQVVLNGGPPCFHLCEDGRFCGRAMRWEGHRSCYRGDKVIHHYVSLANLLEQL